MRQTIGIAGLGALGSIIRDGLLAGIEGFELVGVSETNAAADLKGLPNLSFADLAERCDIVIEALPPQIVPALARPVLTRDKTLILLSACALVLHPELQNRVKTGRIRLTSGALCGLDGVAALKESGIESALIRSTKPPKGFAGAPSVIENAIDLAGIDVKTRIFSGNVLEAARAFPANVNVAATLAFAGIGPEETKVEVWADPDATANRHEIEVMGKTSVIRTAIENRPDPANPKSSVQAAHAVLAALRRQSDFIAVM